MTRRQESPQESPLLTDCESETRQHEHCGRENEWIERAQNGDKQAFDQLITLHRPHLHRLATKVLHDEESADDAVQETLIKIYLSLFRFHGGSFRNWATRIAINTCYDVLRRKRRLQTDSLDALAENEDASLASEQLECNPQRLVDQHDAQQVIEQSIALLPQRQRLAITLYDLQHYSYQEISALTGWPSGTVKSSINRARHKLGERLQAHGMFISHHQYHSDPLRVVGAKYGTIQKRSIIKEDLSCSIAF